MLIAGALVMLVIGFALLLYAAGQGYAQSFI